MIRKLFFIETWTLAVTSDYSNIENIDKCNWKVLKPGFFEYFADPSIVTVDNNNKMIEIVYESIKYFTGKGYLKKLYYSLQKNEILETKIVLENKNHISFPNIYKFQDKQILLYENEEEKKLGIKEYKKNCLDEFKDIEGEYLDPIIAEINKNQYLISSYRNNSKLIFNIQLVNDAFDLKSSDIKYRENKKCIRNGGKMIVDNSEIFRIGQLNNGRYGDGLVFNKLIQNNNEIIEKDYYTLLPSDLNQKFTGLHTFSCYKNLCVIDVRIIKFNPIAVIIKLFRRLRKYGKR